MRTGLAGWIVAALVGCGPSTQGHWPEWRGPHRDNISRETGLLQTWPPEGPPLLLDIRGIGEGVAPPAVAHGRVFLLGEHRGVEGLLALDEESGRRLWYAPLGPRDGASSPLMRWLHQRTPTVDAERVYAFFRSTGELICIRASDGRELWRVDYIQAFGLQRPAFGACDFPLDR